MSESTANLLFNYGFSVVVLLVVIVTVVCIMCGFYVVVKELIVSTYERDWADAAIVLLFFVFIVALLLGSVGYWFGGGA